MKINNLNLSFNQVLIQQKFNDFWHNSLPDRRRALFMASKMRPDFVFHTAALEGNPMTFPEVKTLIDGTTVGGHKVSDFEQVLNINDSFDFILNIIKTNQNNQKIIINKKTVCAVHSIVARNEALTWGEFRDGMVYIAGTNYLPPPPELLNSHFEMGIDILNAESNPILRAFLYFLWGSLNQFFYDGNKRTSRLIASSILLTAGMPPLMVRNQDRQIYNEKMTDFYNNQDATDALMWMLDYYFNEIKIFGFI